MGPLYCIAKASKVLHFNGFRQNAQHVVAFQLASNTTTTSTQQKQQQKNTQISSFRSSQCMWAHQWKWKWKWKCVLRACESIAQWCSHDHTSHSCDTISVCAISSETVTHTDTWQQYEHTFCNFPYILRISCTHWYIYIHTSQHYKTYACAPRTQSHAYIRQFAHTNQFHSICWNLPVRLERCMRNRINCSIPLKSPVVAPSEHSLHRLIW